MSPYLTNCAATTKALSLLWVTAGGEKRRRERQQQGEEHVGRKNGRNDLLSAAMAL